MKDFKDRVAVVTGAANGIGRGMVENFIEAGMKVVLADIDEKRLKTTVKTFKDSGAEVQGVPTDVSKAEQIKALSEKTMDTFGAVHVLCNNAGVGYGGSPRTWEVPLEGWNWIVGVNLMSVIYGVHYFMPIMLKQDTEAHIVNTASIAGLITGSLNAPYSVTKHGVVQLTESMYHELQMLNAKVKVSVLCPGSVNTDILESTFRYRPSDVPIPPEVTGEKALLKEAFRIWVERGLDPKDVGKQVLEAIKNEDLYIVTTNDYDENIKQRMNSILERKNPGPLLRPKALMDIVQEISSKSENKGQ